MKARYTVHVVASILVLAMGAGSVLALRKVEVARGKEATLEEVIYLPSGKALKRMSLGYSSLLADIYWTRAVQYFGAKFQHRSQRYDLLDPLLEITTDLDPRLIPAYQNGAILLSMKPPGGAGQPDKGVSLLEKGIRANPEFWRMYFTLGFVHYMDRKDYKAAKEAFEKGSEVPGAMPWMKVMAASMAERAEEPTTAINLWQGVYQMTKEDSVRDSALKHIASLQADMVMEEIESRMQSYRQQTGSPPARWSDLSQAHLLKGIPVDSFDIPVDPTGARFKLMAGGTVQVEDPKQFPFLGEGRRKNEK
jgi:tetratricopeptide (TPR) repeat protein